MRRTLAILALSGSSVMAFALPASAAVTHQKSHHKSTHHKSHKNKPKPKAATAGSLSGTWSGQYSGAFQGTFSLTWQQSGSTLSGTIKLSAPAISLGINGTVQNNAIHFGTVGGVGVTYTGSVTSNGSSMSGTYQTAGRSGSWSATKGS